MEENVVLDGRACGSCTLCCKVLTIEALGKPGGTWCSHCKVGRGCGIYAERPTECRTFHCGYLMWRAMGEHWFPARSKMVVMFEMEGDRLAVHVDPGRPAAWQEQPYYSDIKHWAISAAARGQQVIVCIGRRSIVVLPDREVDLGTVEDDERIVLIERRRPEGTRIEALKMKADDPRIAGKDAGKGYRDAPGAFG